MKKLALLILFGLVGTAHSVMKEEFNYVPISSYSEAATNSAVFFSSANIRWYGITIGSAAAASGLAIFTSTSATFTPELSTRTFIATDYQESNQAASFIPLFLIKGSS